MLSRAIWFITLLLFASGLSHAQTSPTTSRAILAVSWSPDGQTYAYVDDRGNLAVVDPHRTATIFQFSGGVSNLLHASAEWSPDGTRLAAGIGYQVYLWDTATWELSAQFVAGESDGQAYSEYFGILTEGVTTLSWNFESRFVASASISSITTVWDDQDGRIIYQEIDLSGGFPGRVWLDEEMLTDGGTNLNPFSDETVSNDLARFAGFGDPTALELTNDGRFLAQADVFGYIHINDMNSDTSQRHIEITKNDPAQHRRALADISWNGTGDAIAAVSRDGEIYIADLVTGEVRTILNVPARIHAIDWNPVTGELLYGGVTDSGELLLAIYSDQMRFISQP